MIELLIRKECAADCDSIRSITVSAFRGMPYAGGDEQDVIDRLRSANALTLSLIAVIEEEVVGHIAFSPATTSDGSCPWFALGPVSVIPERQCKGVGRALIENGLAQLKSMNALGCILTGNPAYYKKFGFQLAPENAPSNEPAEFFMLKQLSSGVAQGQFSFHEAFYGDA
ncbi:N-acetyltransferase [Halieaceae bacterium IMCC14734]|uniref:N-acetyltransferase n=1 Tax=Candidatus Litorirhabdus singularis TaxID=2518993 RepID=A0ABT3TD31_9GAMM|nr:N-acetyltransferase [Candidatus Litorirhabdus singularis]MCX2979894.1 N-acetyltransferase [Candidatus Litorirhabdus singularis]